MQAIGRGYPVTFPTNKALREGICLVVSTVNPMNEKYATVQLFDYFPMVRGENNKSFETKPPPRNI